MIKLNILIHKTRDVAHHIRNVSSCFYVFLYKILQCFSLNSGNFIWALYMSRLFRYLVYDTKMIENISIKTFFLPEIHPKSRQNPKNNNLLTNKYEYYDCLLEK